MAPLATAFVRLRSDPSMLAADARRDATRAGEQAGAAMGRSMSSSLSRTFKAAAGIGAATGLVEAGRKVLELADKFEAVRASAEQNTENIGASFTAVQKPLGDLDSKLAALGFTITDTEGSFSQLITATRDPAKAMRDVALAADIARGRHISLSEATQILMRVETGHVAMLGRLGIATRNANGTIFTQQEALDALGQAYGGNAAKFAETFAGKQAAARAEIQQSATEIGVALLPALVDLATFIAHDVLPPLVSTAHWFEQNETAIKPFAKAIVTAALAWKLYSVWAKLARTESTLLAGTRFAGAVGSVPRPGAAAPLAGAAGGPVPVFVTNWMQMAGAGALASTGAGAAAAASSVEAGAAGTAIGAQMAKNLDTPLLNLATRAGSAAASIGTMGVAALGFANLVKNPRSLGFPMGFNNDTGPGDVHKGQQLKLPGGGTGTVQGASTVFFNKQGQPFSDADLKHPIEQTKQLTAATQTLTTAERNLGVTVQRTASQIGVSVSHALDLRSAQDGLREAMHAAAQSVADNGRALTGNSDAALANRDAMRNQVAQIFAVIDAMKARGASDASQANMLAILTTAVENNATKMYGDKKAVDAFLASLGLIPQEAANAAAAVVALDAATAAKTELPGRDVKGGAVGRAGAAQAAAAAKAAAASVAASFTTGFTPVVSKAAKAGASAAESAFNKMKDRMVADIQTVAQSIQSMKSSLEGFADVSNLLSGTDTLGAQGSLPFAQALKDKATQLSQFATLFGRLKKMGLDGRLLLQFEAVGPDAIPAMQQILASGKAGIRQVNSLERQIAGSAGQVATQAAAVENLALIRKDLQQLPTKLAKEEARALRNLGLVVSLKDADRKAGKRIVFIG